MTSNESILAVSLAVVSILIFVNLWQRWRRSDGTSDMEALQHLTVRLAGENQRKEQRINELTSDNTELYRLLNETKRKLERCYERVTPRERKDIEDSWPGKKP